MWGEFTLSHTDCYLSNLKCLHRCEDKKKSVETIILPFLSHMCLNLVSLQLGGRWTFAERSRALVLLLL